jgi:hypothetical protein
MFEIGMVEERREEMDSACEHGCPALEHPSLSPRLTQWPILHTAAVSQVCAPPYPSYHPAPLSFPSYKVTTLSSSPQFAT